MRKNLTEGSVTGSMLLFAVPMILGNLLQQCYNLADAWIVGRYIDGEALAAVGSSFTLMTFLTSILIGLCMGSGAFFSICFGKRDEKSMKEGFVASFLLIGIVTVILNVAVFLLRDEIKTLLSVPDEVWDEMRSYLSVIFLGIAATFLYNYFASLLRAVGNSAVPLVFLAISAVLNIALDFYCILVLKKGVVGAAVATVVSQYISALGLALYTWFGFPSLHIGREHLRVRARHIREITSFSFLTCVQQSVMNLGILMVQGLVNSFGTPVMTAFAAAVKIDAFAYMPVQDFGNAFSTFIAQNYGAGRSDRIRKGVKSAILTATVFSIFVSAVVFLFARPLLAIFIDAGETAVLDIGVRYLRIEGAFYVGIGLLFLLYGLFRAMARPGMSVILTVISLGTRVLLAYTLAPIFGVTAIWWAIPIGWALADLAGFAYYFFKKHSLIA